MNTNNNNINSLALNNSRNICLHIYMFRRILTDLSQPKISRHLAHLRESALLLAQRNGQWMYYRINPELPDWAQAILQHALSGSSGVQPYQRDQQALTAMPNRPGMSCCA